jgi:hypothetical protein
MRVRTLAVPFALCLALASAGLAVADTTPGGGGNDAGLSITVMSTSVVAKTGLVTISGKVTCEADLDWGGVQASVSQGVGRLTTLRGYGWADTAGCVAASGGSPFTMSFYAESGRFAPGRAQLSVDAWGQGGCQEDAETGDVTCERSGSAFIGPVAIRLRR